MINITMVLVNFPDRKGTTEIYKNGPVRIVVIYK